MILTGKCKKDFEKWFENKYDNNNTSDVIILQSEFDSIPFEFQYGVLAYFFDTKGILISVAGLTLSKTYIFEIGIDKNAEYFEAEFKSLDEAGIAVIKKANQLYNLKKP